MLGYGVDIPSLALRQRAASAVGGLTATGYAIASTAQWHAGQSTTTMRADTTFNGYIASNILTVAAGTLVGGAILEGMVISGAGIPVGTKIVKSAQTGGGAGGTGNYVVDTVGPIGSVGSPVAITIAATQITAITDLKGAYDLSNTTGIGGTGEGPRLMTDFYNRKFMRFIVPVQWVGSWLTNLSITGIDTHNFASIAVCRVHLPQLMAIVSAGSKILGTGQSAVQLGTQSNGMVVGNASRPDYNGGSPPANAGKLYAGAQLQVIGAAIATNDGLNASTSGSGAVCRLGINEQSASVSPLASRAINVNGIEIGKLSSQTPSAGSGTQYAYIDLYELTVWTTAQFGNTSAMPARFDAAMAAAQANWGIPNLTTSLVFGGHSLTANGAGAGTGTAAQDGGGLSLATMVAAPGAGLPATWRVLNYAQAGLGIGYMGSVLDRGGTFDNQSSPLLAAHMFGGGNDIFHGMCGDNDYTTKWPTDNFAAGTSGIVDEMYATDRTASFTANINQGSASMVATAITGKIAIGSQVSFSNSVPGLTVQTGTASPFTMNVFQRPGSGTSGSTGVDTAATSILRSYKSFYEALVSRGFKVVVTPEPWRQTSLATAPARLESKIAGLTGLPGLKADITTDLGSTLGAKVRVYQLSLITVSGSLIFGANEPGSNALNDILAEGTHYTVKGKRYQINGGDTPANGILANLLAA